MKFRILILVMVILLPACGGGEGGGAARNEPRDLAASAVDTVAGMVKSGTYLARGSFTGGEITDGRDVHHIEWSARDGFERIEIRIHEAKWGDSENADPVAVPCRFSVSREDFPARLVVVVSGTRMFSTQPPELPDGAMVEGYYRIIYLDDAGSMFAFDVKNDTEFEVFEMHDPAVIVIDIRKVPIGSRGGPESVFSLRSASWPHGERPGHFEEELMRAGAKSSRIVRDADGYFFVEEGWYPARKDAEERQRLLAEEGIILFIEHKGTDDQPGHIPPEHE